MQRRLLTGSGRLLKPLQVARTLPLNWAGSPVTIPFIAEAYGWEMAFIIIGALGFIWMGFWIFLYNKPHSHPKVNKAELEYIQQDIVTHDQVTEPVPALEKKMSFASCFRYKQTWAFAFGKFMTDGVWWFFLFWTPAYLKDIYKMSSTQSSIPILYYTLSLCFPSLADGYLHIS